MRSDSDSTRCVHVQRMCKFYNSLSLTCVFGVLLDHFPDAVGFIVFVVLVVLVLLLTLDLVFDIQLVTLAFSVATAVAVAAFLPAQVGKSRFLLKLLVLFDAAVHRHQVGHVAAQLVLALVLVERIQRRRRVVGHVCVDGGGRGGGGCGGGRGGGRGCTEIRGVTDGGDSIWQKEIFAHFAFQTKPHCTSQAYTHAHTLEGKLLLRLLMEESSVDQTLLLLSQDLRLVVADNNGVVVFIVTTDHAVQLRSNTGNGRRRKRKQQLRYVRNVCFFTEPEKLDENIVTSRIPSAGYCLENM